MEQDLKILERMLKIEKECLHYDVSQDEIRAIEHLIKAYKELEEENEELISDNLDYQRTLDIFDKRTYRKKYLEERRNEEPNLLYPDADEIYKRYYKLREENTSKQKAYDDCYCEFKHYKQYESIPVSLVEEKIEELKRCGNDWIIQREIQVLEKLLERRK